MKTKDILAMGSQHLRGLSGHIFDLLTISKPTSHESAINLSKVISKLSPILGNLIEFNTVEFLNNKKEFQGFGRWERQDPGFPDTIFKGNVVPIPGFEIKAWFPLATEITARFKDSQNHFTYDQTHICMIAWLPENLIYGKPYIVDVCIVSGRSVAVARDTHYHNPPDYLVLEPEDTKDRTRNLQQTNTNGYKWQGTSKKELDKAKKIVSGWGSNGKQYKPTLDYQIKLRELIKQFPYRLDTNFAKMDRIAHEEIEKFKNQVMCKLVKGKAIGEWVQLLANQNETKIKKAFQDCINIKKEDTENLLL